MLIIPVGHSRSHQMYIQKGNSGEIVIPDFYESTNSDTYAQTHTHTLHPDVGFCYHPSLPLYASFVIFREMGKSDQLHSLSKFFVYHYEICSTVGILSEEVHTYFSLLGYYSKEIISL